ncbi:hypothetical protein GA0115255_100323 [Streptomyces sp. Ncost-T6T-2b]|nr:hypothetical protein GA0115255_100323 [Streptomyces sp. Ncost-T6T-2b]
MGGHGPTQPGGDLLVEGAAQELVVVGADHVDDSLVGQRPGPGRVGSPRPIGQVGADEPLGIVHEPNARGPDRQWGLRAKKLRVRVSGCWITASTTASGRALSRQSTILAASGASVSSRSRTFSGTAGLSASPASRRVGRVSVRPDLLRRSHARYPQGVAPPREDMIHHSLRRAQPHVWARRRASIIGVACDRRGQGYADFSNGVPQQRLPQRGLGGVSEDCTPRGRPRTVRRKQPEAHDPPPSGFGIRDSGNVAPSARTLLSCGPSPTSGSELL